MSSRKSYFLQTQHAQTVELERWVESACHESQVRTAEVAAARTEGQCAVERATATEQKLDVAKAHMVETEAVLRKSLEALELERKARSDA